MADALTSVQGTTAVTTKSHKMALPGFVKTPETAGHEPNLRRAVTPGKYTIVGTALQVSYHPVSAQRAGANLGHLAIPPIKKSHVSALSTHTICGAMHNLTSTDQPAQTFFSPLGIDGGETRKNARLSTF